MLTIKVVWSFIKRYWHVFALALGTLVGVFVFRRRIVDFVDDYRKIKDVHEEEIQEIKSAREQEIVKKAQNKKKLDDTLQAVEEQYQKENIELERKKKREIKRIIDKHADDPAALADEVARVTGFRVITPPQE